MGNIRQTFNFPDYVTLVSDGATATLAQWQAALQAVYFQSLSDNPGSSDRSINYTVNDGSSDSLVATRLVRVTAVNDAPMLTATSGSTAYAENDAPTVIDAGVTVADVDNSTLAAATVSISGGLANGQDVLAFANTGAAAMGNISASYNSATRVLSLNSAGATATTAQWQAALRAVTYHNNSDNPDTANRTISFMVSDGTDTSNVATRSISLTPGNDAAVIVISPGITHYTENDSYTAVDAGVTLSDADNATLASAEVTITGNYTADDFLGIFIDAGTMGNIQWIHAIGPGTVRLESAGATATVAQWQAALRAVIYINNSDNPVANDRTVSFTINDGSVDSAVATRVLRVTAVNDAPVVTASGNPAVYYKNDAPLALSPAVVLDDVDNATLASATVSVTAGFAFGQDVLAFSNTGNAAMGNISASYNASTGVLSMVSAGSTATIAQWQTALRSVTYANTSNSPSTSDRTIGLVINDGISNSTPVYSIQRVEAVNHAPVGTAHAIAVQADTPYVFSASDFGFTDPRDVPSNALLSVTITTLPAQGTLRVNGVALAAGDVVQKSDIDAGRLVFTFASSAASPAFGARTVDGMHFQVRDDGGTANGGVDTDPTPRALTIMVSSLNSAPVGTPHTVTALENNAYTFAASDFGFTDPGSGHADQLLQVQITTLPASGTLSFQGIAVRAGSWIDVAGINAGALTYMPAANANGAALAVFTFQVRDDGGTAGGGIDTDATPRLLSIDVTPVNSAPTGNSQTLALLDDRHYTFTAADFGFADASDSPANRFASVRIVTLPSAGILSINGRAVAAGDMVLAADIEAGRLVYAPQANIGVKILLGFSFQVRDDGGLANGGADTDLQVRLMTLDIANALVGNPGIIMLPSSFGGNPSPANYNDDTSATRAAATVAATSATQAASATSAASSASAASVRHTDVISGASANAGVLAGQANEAILRVSLNGFSNDRRDESAARNVSEVNVAVTVPAAESASVFKTTVVVQAPTDRRSSLMAFQKISSSDFIAAQARSATAGEEDAGERGALGTTVHRIEAAVAVSALSAIWVVARKAALVSSLLSTVPAWLRLDPMPILSGSDEAEAPEELAEAEDTEQGDSVEHLFTVEGKVGRQVKGAEDE